MFSPEQIPELRRKQRRDYWEHIIDKRLLEVGYYEGRLVDSLGEVTIWGEELEILKDLLRGYEVLGWEVKINRNRVRIAQYKT